MRQKSGTSKEAADRLVRGIKRKTRKRYSAEEKTRVVLSGLRGEESIAALCRREGMAESLYYSWSKEFLESGKQRLAGESEAARVSAANAILYRGYGKPKPIPDPIEDAIHPGLNVRIVRTVCDPRLSDNELEAIARNGKRLGD